MFRSNIYQPGTKLADDLRAQFKRDHYAAFPNFIQEDLFPQLMAEVNTLVDGSMRRDFLMACMDNSPRRMNVVSGPMIDRAETRVPELYNMREVHDFLSYVIDDEVLPLVEDIDRYVINHLERTNDTFGAHYDDYPLSFVIIIASPEEAFGGYAEMAPRAKSLAELEDNPIRLPLRPGDAYVLKTDTTAHRVAPLRADMRRTAINFAYTTPGFVPLGTDSAAQLYSG